MVRLHRSDRVTLRNCPGVWRVHKIEGRRVWLTGIDNFAKTVASLDTCGIVSVSRQDVATEPIGTGDTLL